MNKLISAFFAVLLLMFNASGAHAQAEPTELYDWGFYIDGITYCLIGPDCNFDVEDIGNLNGPEDLPSFIDISNFDFTTGLGLISITIADPGSHSVVMFVDHDIDVDLNDFDNETGVANGSPETGQTWEIDEPGGGSLQDGSAGFPYYGDIFFNNFLFGIPDNRAFYDAIDDQTLTPPDDVSMAMGWDFELVADESTTMVFSLSTSSAPQGFHLVHRDPDSDVNIYFSSSLDRAQNAETDCFDGVDNDGDGSMDCADPDCAGATDGSCDTGQPGICSTGITTCQSEASVCVPDNEAEPDDASCNNVDDDCDGSTDEDFPATPTTCGVGECASTGQKNCVAGVEGDTCTPGTAGAEVCDNLDNDCDGSTDESLTRPTSCGIGECSGNTGEETCTGGTWGGDTCDPLAGAVTEGPPGDATCGDTLDNDCDGQTDLADPGCETVCSPTGTPETVCNGVDDDCDGSTDEDFPATPTTCGAGECASTGQTTCVAGVEGDTCTPETPGAEVCDNLDNDCDGSTDESLTRPTSCGIGECSGNTGEETCTAGTWGGDTCDPFAGAVSEGPPGDATCGDTLDNDCDGQTDLADPGCETVCSPTGTPETVCNGVDDDCDGSTDEDFPATPTTCGVGACASTGQTTCVAGAEGDTCTPGTPGAEVCDNLDNDCDGATDESLTRPTSCGVGECAGNMGEETCTAGTWGGDTCDPLAGAVTEGPPGDATCEDTLDNDCDGQADSEDIDCQEAATTLSDWGFYIDGITYCLLGPCDFDVDDFGNINGPEDLPPFIDISNFDFTAGLGSISISIAAPGSHSVVMFVDHDIDVDLNDFDNETGLANGSPAMGQTWEIDEPGGGSLQDGSAGFPYFGDIFFDNFLIGMPDNRAFYDAIDDQTLTPPDDVSMAMGWDFELVADESTTMVFSLSTTSAPQGFHLVHRDPDSDVNIYFSSSLDGAQNIETDCFDGVDNDGDGSMDCADPDCEGTTDGSCDTGQPGICSTGITTCQSETSVCVPDTEAELNDATCDGLDNDCDGQVDEDFQSILTACGTGVCARAGQIECVNGQEVDTCTPGPQDETTDVTCDGQDGDCDGDVDEDFQSTPTTCGVGACEGNTGQVECQGGSEVDICDPFAGAAPDDSACNNIDDDCDGEVNEDFQTTPTTCGVGACEGNTGQIACQGGSEVDTCDPVAGAMPEGPPGNGACSDTVDNDCDGITDMEDDNCVSEEVEIINNRVTLTPMLSTYSTTSDTSGCPTGFVGIFSFNAEIKNISDDSLSSIIDEVAKLTEGNLLQNADGGPGGEGAVMTVPLSGSYSDGDLAPGESADIPFKICLKDLSPFLFFVDIFGVAD